MIQKIQDLWHKIKNWGYSALGEKAMLKSLISTYLCLSFIIKPVYANSIEETNFLDEISQPLKIQIMDLISRQSGGTQRPESCPLESNLHLDLLTKVQTIKNLFQDNCLDSDQTIIDEILSGAKTIQEDIDSIQETTDSNNPEDTAEESATAPEISTGKFDIGGVSIDGKTIANVLSNINDIYKKKACSKLSEDKNFLSSTADIILDISKIGLLVPNTTVLTVAGGGVAISSTLNILSNVFTKRFDFEETEDRQTFIKLNCAFYDIRRDIEKSGFLDISTESHLADQIIVKDLIEKTQKEFKAFNKKYNQYLKDLEKNKKSFYEIQSNHLFELVTETELLKIETNKPITMQSQKLALIELITRLSPSTQQYLTTYIEGNSDNLNFLNLQFLSLLKKFDYANVEEILKLQEMDFAEFTTTIQETMKYHLNRLEKTYADMQVDLDKKWKKESYLGYKNSEKFMEELDKEKNKKTDDFEKLYLGLENVRERLKRIVDEIPFTSTDDGTENVVSILSEFNSIVDNIYGKHGEKFLNYTTKKALKMNDQFNSNFDDFANNHLSILANGISIRSKNDLTPLRLMYACQDARPFRRQWKLAESLAQQGYDFVATNADLFHSDIKRIWFGRSGNRKFGIHNFLSKYEKIQMHHKSSIYAKKKISGVPFDKVYEKKYLHKKYLGRAILEVTESKKKAKILQELIEIYDCPLRTIMP